jgi:hypothetical protein
MKKLFTFTLLSLLALGSLLTTQPARAAGNEYFVSTRGSDDNPGTLELPFRSIQKAADIATAGDTVYVRDGIYAEKVNVPNSGAAERYITFSSYPNETAILDESGIAMPAEFEGGFTVNSKKYIQISGFEVQNSANGLGIICYRSEHCVLKNNKTTFSGIAVRESVNVTIEGNEVQFAGGGKREMISVAGSSFVNITDNDLHNDMPGAKGNDGIDIKDGSHDVLANGNSIHNAGHFGVYVDARSSHEYNVTLDGNDIQSALSDGIALASGRGGELNHVSIINNVLYKNASSGIVIGDWGSGSIHDIYIVNNTAYANGTGAGGGIDIEAPNATGIFVGNNILSKNAGFTINVKQAPLAKITITHNLLDGFKNLDTEQRGTEFIEAEPKFYNTEIPNLRLFFDSPAVGSGSTLNAPNHDLVNAPRAGGMDMGAYKYNPSAAIPLFWDTFDNAFSGWEKTPGVAWYTGSQKIGSHGVLLTGNSSMSTGISTQGYESVTLFMYFDVASYEAGETLSIDWWDGTVWQPLETLTGASPKEKNKLNRLKIILPPGTSDYSDFKLRIIQNNADATDYAYVDSIEVNGVKERTSTGKIMIDVLIGVFILLGMVSLLRAEQ